MMPDFLKILMENYVKEDKGSFITKIGNDFYMSYDIIEIQNNSHGGMNINFKWHGDEILCVPISFAKIENDITVRVETTGKQKFTISDY